MAGYDRQMMNLLTDMEILEGDIAVQEEEIEQANADLEHAKHEGLFALMICCREVCCSV